MDKDKMIEWIGTHSTGVSSRTMWCGLMGLKLSPGSNVNSHYDVPHDADDFSRCLDLVVFARVTEEGLQKIPITFPFYKPIIDCWTDLREMYELQQYEYIYSLLSSKEEEVMGLRGYKKTCYGYKLKENGN